METKRILRITGMILFIVIMVAGMSACTRSKSAAPASVPTGDTGFTLPSAQPTDQNMGIFDQLNTQTPQAGGGLPPTQAPAGDLAATATLPVVPAPVVSAPATAVPAPVKIEPTQGPLPATYTLQKGEHPFCIARRFNVDQYELLSVNGLGTSSTVQAGDTLKLPQSGKHFVSERSLKTHPAQYTIRSGDTVYTIAWANNLSSPYTLSSGQIINIP
jgi:LysM repeat protein